LVALPRAQTAGAWDKQTTLPTPVTLRDVQVVSPTAIWAVGDHGVIIHSGDTGRAWSSSQVPSTQLNDVHFVDANHGWSAASDGTYRPTDGGRSWTDLSLQFLGYGKSFGGRSVRRWVHVLSRPTATRAPARLGGCQSGRRRARRVHAAARTTDTATAVPGRGCARADDPDFERRDTRGAAAIDRMFTDTTTQ